MDVAPLTQIGHPIKQLPGVYLTSLMIQSAGSLHDSLAPLMSQHIAKQPIDEFDVVRERTRETMGVRLQT